MASPIRSAKLLEERVRIRSRRLGLLKSKDCPHPLLEHEKELLHSLKGQLKTRLRQLRLAQGLY